MNLKTYGVADCVILSKGVSHTGKYIYFYGQHYVKGKQCWDVGAIDTKAGTIHRRHWTGPTAKTDALLYYDEFREQLTKPSEDSDSHEEDAQVYLN